MEWKLIVLLISLLPWVGYGETSVSEVRLVCEGQQLDNTMNSIMKLSDEMGDMRNTIKSLDLALKDVASLKVQNTALEASKSVLQKGNEALSARVESLEKGMSSVETNLRSLQQDSTRTKQQNRILTINLSRLQEQGNKVEKATEQLAEMDLALNTSKEELREALNNSIQELKSKGDKDSSNVGMSITDIRADVENLKRSATEGKQYSDQLLDITRELSFNNSISVSNHNRLVSQHATTRADTDALQDGLSELQRESNIILNDHINLKSTDEDIKGNVLSLQNNHNSMNSSLSKLSQNTNDQFIMAEGKVNGSFTEVQTNVDAVVKLILNQSESYMNVLQMMFQSARVEREGIWQAHNGAYGSVNASIIALMNTNRLVSDSLTNLSTDQVQIQQRLETFQLEQLAQNGRIANVWETSAGNLTSLVYGLQSETNDIRTNLSKTIKETDKFINSMGALLNQSVGSKIQGAVSSIENIFSNIEDLKGETRNLSDKLKAGDNRTEAVSRKLEVSIARIEASEKRTDAVNGNLQASIQRIEANEKAIGTSQDDIKMGKNESDNRYLQTQTSISQLQNQTSTAQKESTTNVLTTIRDLKANYSGLQNEVTALKADKSSLFGVVNMLQTQNGATSQSITKKKKVPTATLR